MLFVISGYSFSDQHINEVIFNSLRQNSRLHIIVFAHTDSTIDELHKLSSAYLNLTAFGVKKGIVNGEICEWSYNKNDLKMSEQSKYYWNDEEDKLIIGDFKKLVEFIITNSGRKETIEHITNE